MRLIKFIHARNASVFKSLLFSANARISLGVTDEIGASALTIAAERNSVSTVLALLRAGASVNLRYMDMTPLLIAALNDHLAVTEALMRAGAAIDQAEANWATPLCIASKQATSRW